MNHTVQREAVTIFLEQATREVSSSDVPCSAYLVEKLCPRGKDITISPWKLSPLIRSQITKKRKNKSLRELAEEYGVSQGTVRRATKRKASN